GGSRTSAGALGLSRRVTFLSSRLSAGAAAGASAALTERATSPTTVIHSAVRSILVPRALDWSAALARRPKPRKRGTPAVFVTECSVSKGRLRTRQRKADICRETQARRVHSRTGVDHEEAEPVRAGP